MNESHPGIPAIEVGHVTKRFGSVTAVDDASFSVSPGELFFLLGPSGCGKTTLLRILAGLESPDSGTVKFGGRDVAALPPHRRGAPMVFQNYALWPHLKVKDNVAFGLVERRVPKREIEERVRATLRQVGLEPMADRTPGQLSGGQQQRVVLARALVLNPEVMLLDEPLSNLDARLRADMREEIGKLHRETRITFVYVTHDQGEALSLADRLVVMHEGKIRAAGSPRDLYRRPPNVFCADFLGEANLIEASVTGMENDRATVKTAMGTWRAVCPAGVRLNEGSAVTCLIRPENMRVSRQGQDVNGLEGDVCSLRFNGPTVTAVLKTPEQELKATLTDTDAKGLRPGVRASFWIDVDNTVIVPGS
jgi:iron(III) transport system ATP-binding protein